MDPDQFVGEVSDNFLCAICLMVVEDPIEHVDCEKIFCKGCIQDYMATWPGASLATLPVLTVEWS